MLGWVEGISAIYIAGCMVRLHFWLFQYCRFPRRILKVSVLINMLKSANYGHCAYTTVKSKFSRAKGIPNQDWLPSERFVVVSSTMTYLSLSLCLCVRVCLREGERGRIRRGSNFDEWYSTIIDKGSKLDGCYVSKN